MTKHELLEAIKYSRGSLQLLDQRLLPLEQKFLEIKSCEDAHARIKEMAVRGAPAIAIAGFLALAVELHNAGAGAQFKDVAEACRVIEERSEYLVTSRPTAVNLLDTARKLSVLLKSLSTAPDATAASVTSSVIGFAEKMQQEDIDANMAIGAFGMEGILASAAVPPSGKIGVLTHCNTGSLATVQYGTALGCIRALRDAGKLEHAFCTETRPYNQGARLTAFELVTEGIPATLIADSAAAPLLASGKCHAVVVGADRVAANGDTANKVGTRMLSIVAKAAGVPFFVAAPSTSIDVAIAKGSDIEIEERTSKELTHAAGGKGERVVVEGIDVWNPAFDVAEAAFITGIITEKGVISKTGDTFDIYGFFQKHSLPIPSTACPPGSSAARPSTGGASPPPGAPPGFKALDSDSVRDYVAADEKLTARVGPVEGKANWKCGEIGDGNINYVYVVEGPGGAVVVKQGLPYIRCVGESWPLSQERLRYEVDSLRAMHAACPAHTPEVYSFDATMCVIAMQYIAPPAVVLRYGILDGAIYPCMPAQAAEFLACTLFRSSQFALGTDEFTACADKYGNREMCALTEKVIFTDPYYEADVNKHTSPQLDNAAAALRRDPEAKAAALAAKAAFCQRREALLHGDLHTGSCIVSDTEFYVIDSEFAFYGPMAFDVGKFMANLLLTFFALDGHSTGKHSRADQRSYVLDAVSQIWNKFSARFCELWTSEAHPESLSFSAVYSTDTPSLHKAQDSFMRQLLTDALRFGGCVMIRRLLGIAHNADFERIQDQDVKAVCELRALRTGRELLVNCAQYKTVEEVLEMAQKERQDGSQPLFPMAAGAEQ